jgi:septal ring factor EnvC (AmiA/AmiB activator)
MLIEAAKIATIVVLALIIVAGAARSQQQDQPMVQQCLTELTKTARERDAGSDFVAAVLTELADAKSQAAAANQQIAATAARITNLIKENSDLTKERDELKAKAGSGVMGTPPPSSTMPASAPPGPEGPAAGGLPP